MASSWKTDMWFVSPFNFVEEVRKDFKPPKTLVVHDVTMRDGEGQAGVIFTKSEKLRIARALERLGVDRVEVGIPSISMDDRDVLRALNAAKIKVKLVSWCRLNKVDVDVAADLDSWGVTIELPASRQAAEKLYGGSLESFLEKAVEVGEHAKSRGLHVTFLCVDSSRSDLETLEKVIKTVEGVADSIALSDTYGVLLPQAAFYLFKKLSEISSKPLEAHCHNDFGLAAANSLAAIAGGAQVVHVSVNGIGERAGNAPLAEVVLGAKLLLGVDVNLKLEELRNVSRVVEEASGVKVAPNKPVVGDNIFSVESAQAGLWYAKAKESGDYTLAFPFRWDLVGFPGVKTALSKKSGPVNVILKMQELNLPVDESKLPNILLMVAETSIRKKAALTDEEFLEILEALGVKVPPTESYVQG